MPTLVAHVADPEPRTLMIYATNPGWKIVVEKMDGASTLVADRWEEKLSDIPRYIREFAIGEISWVDQGTGQTIDLAAFVAQHTG